MSQVASTFPTIRLAGLLQNEGIKTFRACNANYALDVANAVRNSDNTALAPIVIETLPLSPTNLFDADVVKVAFVGDVEIQLLDNNGTRIHKIKPNHDATGLLMGHYAIKLESFNGEDVKFIPISEIDMMDTKNIPIIQTILGECLFTQKDIETKINFIDQDFQTTLNKVQVLDDLTMGQGEIQFVATVKNNNLELPQEPLNTSPITAKSLIHAVQCFTAQYPDCTVLSVSQI